jgi:hypothetical protein
MGMDKRLRGWLGVPVTGTDAFLSLADSEGAKLFYARIAAEFSVVGRAVARTRASFTSRIT